MLNLLENAYNYCKCDGKSSQKYINLTMKKNGDYLTISVVNSYAGKIKSKAAGIRTGVKEHGWGRIIVRDIAKKYGGQFNTIINKKEYTAKVILCSGKGEEAEIV